MCLTLKFTSVMFRTMNNIACQIDLRASLLYYVIFIVYVKNIESDARFFSSTWISYAFIST